MEEPTVLDYVKSKIFFWRGERIEIPDEEFKGTEFQVGIVFDDELLPAENVGSESIPSGDSEPLESSLQTEPRDWWPFARIMVALIFAFMAQRFLEPPERSVMMGVILYALAAGWVIWATWQGDWLLPEREVEWKIGWQEITFQPISLLIAIILGVIAFVSFGSFRIPLIDVSIPGLKDNTFTTFNVIVWILSLVFFLRAFWQTELQSLHFRGKIRNAWESFLADGIHFSPWTLLVLASFALTVFFRMYKLDQVPGEMFSDHAEKLLDVTDVLEGQYSIFFPRNTGREAFQMYLTATMALVFNTGISFMSLKLGTTLAGVFTLPFIYLTGKEIANKRVGLLAMIFAGIAYWPNVISRVALRFTLYPFFYTPMLYFLVRGFRRRCSNDFILAGLFLGLGLHGYSPYRFVPFVVLLAFGLYLLHRQSQGARKQAVNWLALTGFTSVMVFLPLMRYWLSNPGGFSYRAMSRMTGIEQPLPGPAWEIFLKNTGKALVMFFWDNGEIWVHSVMHRPALDVISAALFFLGVFLLVVRYIRKRNWLDIFWLLSIPLLMMPSILSLAFPAENPSLNRTGAAMVPVFFIVGLTLDGLITGLKASLKVPWGRAVTYGIVAILLFLSIRQNYDLVFHQYKTQFDNASWNTSELGAVIRQFIDSTGDQESAWVIPYPHWVDTRLVGINAGLGVHDFALWADQLEETLDKDGPKLFLLKPEDTEALLRLRSFYPTGSLRVFETEIPGKSFYIFTVPPVER